MVRPLLSGLMVALLFGIGHAHASGVERGSVPAEVGTTTGVPSKVQAVAEQAIRDRCNLDGVDRVYAQDFTTDIVATPSGGYDDHYLVEYTVYYPKISYVKSIVVDASIVSHGNEVVINGLNSDLCK